LVEKSGSAIVVDDSIVYRVTPSTGRVVRIASTNYELVGNPIRLANGRLMFVERREGAFVFEVGEQSFTFPSTAAAEALGVQYVPV